MICSQIIKKSALLFFTSFQFSSPPFSLSRPSLCSREQKAREEKNPFEPTKASFLLFVRLVTSTSHTVTRTRLLNDTRETHPDREREKGKALPYLPPPPRALTRAGKRGKFSPSKKKKNSKKETGLIFWFARGRDSTPLSVPSPPPPPARGRGDTTTDPTYSTQADIVAFDRGLVTTSARSRSRQAG